VKKYIWASIGIILAVGVAVLIFVNITTRTDVYLRTYGVFLRLDEPEEYEIKRVFIDGVLSRRLSVHGSRGGTFSGTFVVEGLGTLDDKNLHTHFTLSREIMDRSLGTNLVMMDFRQPLSSMHMGTPANISFSGSLDEFTLAIFEPLPGGHGSWNSDSGAIFSAPASNPSEALVLFHSLMPRVFE